MAPMQKHWDALTLFLREPGAPLDNNVVERVLKRAIVDRKNSLFYRTFNGARVGDTFMSLIYTRCAGAVWGRSLPLPRRAAAILRRGPRIPRRVDAVELPGDACTSPRRSRVA